MRMTASTWSHPTRRMISRLILGLICLVLAGMASPSIAWAHPEDELCSVDGGMDPALCAQLQALDRAGPVDATSRTNSVLGDIEIDTGRSTVETIVFYVRIGFEHILPKGLDHILFVLALFLSSERLRPLLWQVSAFTIAHTATLGLAAAGVISPSPGWVEPLIALTIAWAAIENIIFKEPSLWRPVLVFGFGLIHGMGFAGVFGDLGLPADIFWPSLIGFNVGVELGQLAIIGMAFAVTWTIRRGLMQLGSQLGYRALVVLPVSGLIAAIGVYWALQRSLGGG